MSIDSTIVMAFTVEQAEKLTSVSKSQLLSWHRRGFFEPAFEDDNTRLSYSRLYSFRDLACLRVLNALRNESRVPLSELERVKDKLSHLGEHLWAITVLYVLNREVVFDNPETSDREVVNTGQKILKIPLKVVTGDLKRDVDKLKERDPSKIGKIEKLRGVAQSQPTIAGTRIRVDVIKEFSDAGYSVEEILSEYPSLKKEDVDAALNFKGAA